MILNKIIPMAGGSAFKNKGVQFLLDAVVDYLPSPVDIANTAAVNVTPVSSPFDTWASALPDGQRGAKQTPMGDGGTNLEKFAFNMNQLAPDVRHLTVGANETAGLPGGVVTGGVLRIEFLRRKFVSAANPGITYTAQGQADNPKVMVNPLSAVMPGILRRIFEPPNKKSAWFSTLAPNKKSPLWAPVVS